MRHGVLDLQPSSDRALVCPVAVAEGVVQQPLFVADEAFLQDREDNDDDEQRGKSPEEDGDADEEKDRAKVHGVPARAIEAVAD